MAVRLSKVSKLHAACGAGDITTVQAYIKNERTEMIGGKTVKIFHLDPEGASALALAAMGGHASIVQLLLPIKMPPKSNADVNGQSLAGTSPLMLAALHGHLDTVKLLLEAGADVTALSKVGESALHYAARNRDPHSRSGIMEALVAAGADAALLNAKGLTAADLAAGKDSQAADAPAPPAPAPAAADAPPPQVWPRSLTYGSAPTHIPRVRAPTSRRASCLIQASPLFCLGFAGLGCAG